MDLLGQKCRIFNKLNTSKEDKEFIENSVPTFIPMFEKLETHFEIFNILNKLYSDFKTEKCNYGDDFFTKVFSPSRFK